MDAVNCRTDVKRVVDWAKNASGEDGLSPEEALQRLNPIPKIRSEKILSCGAVKHLYTELHKSPVILGTFFKEQFNWTDTAILTLTTGGGGFAGAKGSTWVSAKWAILGGPNTALAIWVGGTVVGAAA